MIIERLHDTLGLSKAEAEVARWILAHGNEVRNLSVDGLARAAGVSAATIVRFCKKLGTSGYREFRMAFAAEWGSGPGKVAVDANVPFEEHDSYEQVAWKLGNVAANAMNNVISNLDYECVGGVVQWMHDADVINVFTSGTSIPAALDFKTKMVRIGRQINVDQDVLIQRGYALSATRRSCNLVISHSGETEQMVSYARILNAIALRLRPNQGARSHRPAMSWYLPAPQKATPSRASSRRFPPSRPRTSCSTACTRGSSRWTMGATSPMHRSLGRR